MIVLRRHNRFLHRANSVFAQNGIATLTIAVVLLVAATLIILFVTNNNLLQQKSTANQNRNNQAFFAADAGIQFGIAYLNNNRAAVIANPVSGFINYSVAALQNITLSNNSKFTVVYTNPTANNFNVITITSTGTSDDGTSTRVISQQVSFQTMLVHSPTLPLTSVGAVTLSGSSNVKNLNSNSTIQSGSTVSFSGSGSTTTSTGGSNKNHNGGDTSASVSSLNGLTASQFFNSMFGVSSSSVKNGATYCATVSACSLSITTSGVVWIDSSATINDSVANQIGTAVSPVIMIVNGSFSLSGGTSIYGIIYAFGNSSVGNGTAQVFGALLSAGTVNTTGNISINYDTTTINNVSNIGTYAKIPGSWRDF